MPFAPTDIAGIKLWLKADALSLSDGATVTSWTDSSGLGNNAGSPAGTMTYKSNIVNGLPVVRTAGSATLASGASSSPTTCTGFAVLNYTAGAHRGIIGASGGFGGGALEWRINQSTNTQTILAEGVAGIGTSTAAVPTGFNVIAFSFTAATSYAFYLNGAASGSGSHSVTLATAQTVLLGTSTTAEFFVGDYAELILYNSVLSSTDRTSVTNYLGNKYAISGFSPTSAPRPFREPAPLRRQAIIRASSY